jgi:hypothetical protein
MGAFEIGSWGTFVKLTLGRGLLGLAIGLGLVFRVAPAMLADFPLLDGGLFATMAGDLRAASFVPPLLTSYNGAHIPFAYPPLGIFALAAIPGDPIGTERWLPIVWSLASIAFAYVLIKELRNEAIAGAAALIFATMPVAWGIEGGGVTRELGQALVLCAVWRAATMLRAPTRANAAWAGIAAGLSILSHPAAAPVLAVSVAALCASQPSRRGLAAAAWSVTIAVVVASPWLVMVLARYGPAPLASAAVAHHTDETLGRLLVMGPSYLAALDFVAPLALLGLIVVLRRREWLLPVWLLLLIAVPGGEGRFAAVAWASLAAEGVTPVAHALRSIGAQRVGIIAATAWLLVAGLIGAYRNFEAIPVSVRGAMLDAGRSVPVGSHFAVVIRNTQLSKTMLDWFPTLSGRISVGTSMGLEWTSAERWDRTVALDYQIQAGDIPSEADYVFTIDGDAAGWAAAP